MQRSITVTPYFQRHFIPNKIDGYRMRLVVTDAENVSPKIFRFLLLPIAPGSSSRAPVFDGICSPVDLEELPEDQPDPNLTGDYYRAQEVDLVFRSRHEAMSTWQHIKQDIQALLDSLAYMDDLEQLDPVTFQPTTDGDSGA